MVRELSARRELPRDIVEGVSERTGGVPLFVEEVSLHSLALGLEGQTFSAGNCWLLPLTLPCRGCRPSAKRTPARNGETHRVVRVERAPNGCGLASTSGCQRGGRPRDFRARIESQARFC